MSKKLRSNYKMSRSKKNVPERFYTKEETFISRMASILLFPPGKIKALFSKRTVTTIRMNPLKGNVQKTYKDLESKGCQLEEIPWAENVFFVRNKDKSQMADLKEYKDGLFYIQNLSSTIPSLVLDPKEDEKIMDMCASPGSKTTHICAITNNKAKVVANDSDKVRIDSLRNVLHQFGAKAEIVLGDGRDWGVKYPDHFDKILLDAPCSGEGLIYLNGMNPLRSWSIKKVNFMSTLQKELIDSAFRALKPGGTLVYSTCTLEPEENEGVVTYLLNEHKKSRIVDINIEGINGVTRGITKWSGNTYHQEVAKSIRVIPSAEKMGFYLAKIIKK
jgi:NOL1/NOP2/sun family putative RNA methylase